MQVFVAFLLAKENWQANISVFPLTQALKSSPHSETRSVSKINRVTTHNPSQHLDTLIFCFDDMKQETWRHVSIFLGPERC